MDQKIILERVQKMLRADPVNTEHPASDRQPRVSASRWLAAWSELAAWSSKVPSRNHSRALKLLSEADIFFEKDDWSGFERIYRQFQQLGSQPQ